MSGGVYRIAVSLVVLVHGIGHVLFLAPCLGITHWGQAAEFWVLTRTVGDAATRLVGGLLWTVVVIGFTGAGVGLLGEHGWWRPLATASAVVSLLALILFVGEGNTQPILRAALMDIAILVALLWVHWPSADLVGA